MNSTKSAYSNSSISPGPAVPEPRHYPRDMVFGMLSTPIMADHHDLNESVEAHEHSFMEVALVASGIGHHLTVGGTQPIAAGDIIVVHPGQWHAYVECEHLVIRNCCFGAEFLEAELAWVLEEPGVSALLRPSLTPEPLLLRLPLDAIAQCLAHLDALVPQVIELKTGHKFQCRTRTQLLGHLLLLLAEIGRYVEPDHPAAKGKASHPAVQKVLHLLHTNLTHTWTLGQLARTCGNIDETYLIRLFRRETGETPIGYLARMRASRAAARLLRYPQEPIAQVGAAVGWYDPNYFARRFRQFYKQSPRQFRDLAELE